MDGLITKGPKKISTSTTAKLTFKSQPTGATFECKLDKAKGAKCRSPKTYKKLKPGKHTFQVRALLGAVKGPTPAKCALTSSPDPPSRVDGPKSHEIEGFSAHQRLGAADS